MEPSPKKKGKVPKRWGQLNSEFFNQPKSEEILINQNANTSKTPKSTNPMAMTVAEIFVDYFGKQLKLDPDLPFEAREKVVLEKTDLKDYVIINTQSKTLRMPNHFLSNSEWFSALFKSEIAFKEQKTRHVDFLEFESEHVESVLKWLCLDSIFNPQGRGRIAFEFFINPEDMLQVLELAEYLDIEILIDSLLPLILEFISDIPKLALSSSRLINKIVDKIKKPTELLEFESREDFEECNKDTKQKWLTMSQNWTPSILAQCMSWEPTTVLFAQGFDSVSSPQFYATTNKDRFWSRLYCEHILNEYSRTMSERVSKPFKEILEMAGPLLHKLVLTGDTLKQFSLPELLSQVPNLRFLEISDCKITPKLQETLLQGLASLQQLQQLKLCQLRGDVGTLIAQLFRHFPKQIPQLEFCDLGLTSDDVSVFGEYLEKTALTHLSFANNKLGLRGFLSLLLVCPTSLKVLDLSSNRVQLPREVNKEQISVKTKAFLPDLNTLIVSGNELSIYWFDATNFPKLDVLDVSNCEVDKKWVRWLPTTGLALKALNLSNNPSGVCRDIFGFPTVLQLDNVNLRNIDPSAIQNMKQLTTLSLINTEIELAFYKVIQQMNFKTLNLTGLKLYNQMYRMDISQANLQLNNNEEG